MNKTRTFECGLNKMSFTGKSDREIRKVLDMFGGDWTETTEQKMTKLECHTCGNVVKIPKKVYEELMEHAEFIRDTLTECDSNNTVFGGIITMMDRTQICCKNPNYFKEQ